ncbi:multiple epidermal growth factor-like domains protein 10 isoform X1 [Stomoxys calcitrans]|uniref:multiple epidermal growth factor-like domains protein 10 isoform X1 n=1 Tax=Stomoxys calcitrans TaxID=35570 RepID=UPI0027E31784|nr:multiple epidermal growth factor-like domains protein 10 isoform X1 [Stomoxys calcitrans]
MFISSSVFIKVIIISVVIFKTSATEKDNFCEAIVEKTKIGINGESIKYNQTVRTCCEGYITYNLECKPKCMCTNNDCLNPGKCICSKGYKKPWESAHFCVPVCEPACPQYSTCERPDDCVCYPGYEKNSETGECDLQCDTETRQPNFDINECVLKDCICSSGGYCLDDRNRCICSLGYNRTKDNQCEPQCQPLCINSDCNGPNQCRCWTGYHSTDKPHVCEAEELCRGKPCQNGVCLDTGECRCRKGFTKSFNMRGRIVCETMAVFIGKIMSVILGLPLALVVIVLLIVYVVALKRKKQSANNVVQNYSYAKFRPVVTFTMPKVMLRKDVVFADLS